MGIKKKSQFEIAASKIKAAGLTLHAPGRRVDRNVDVSLSLHHDRSTGQINFWAAKDAQYEFECLDTSKKHRQAILRLAEPARTIKATVHERSNAKKLSIKEWASSQEDLRWKMRRKVVLPETEGIKFKAKLIGTKNLDPMVSTYHYMHDIEITAQVPATNQYFLVGYDEDHCFISMLPKPAQNVPQAHEVLMPPEVARAQRAGREVLRSGEFFLVEANEKEDAKITELMQRELLRNNGWGNIGERFNLHEGSREFEYFDKATQQDVFTDHIPFMSLDIDGDTFVCHCMGNDRHFIAFDGWYKMVRNTEVEPPNNAAVFD